MGTTLDDLYEHEGYAARKLPDGTLTGTWSAATKEFLAFVPACSCSRRGGSLDDYENWYGSTEYPPTEAGEEAAIDEWERIHARPLLGSTLPVGLDDEVTELLHRLRTLAEQRPTAVLPTLRRIERATDDLLAVAVANARASVRSWSEIGTALGMSKQSAQQRFKDAAGTGTS